MLSEMATQASLLLFKDQIEITYDSTFYLYIYIHVFVYENIFIYCSIISQFYTQYISIYALQKQFLIYLFHMACLLPGVNSAISVRDEWTNISQSMKLNYVFSELEIGQRSKHQIILVITCILNCTYSEIYDLIKTLHCCWVFFISQEIMKTLNHFTHKSANNLSFSSFF